MLLAVGKASFSERRPRIPSQNARTLEGCMNDGLEERLTATISAQGLISRRRPASTGALFRFTLSVSSIGMLDDWYNYVLKAKLYIRSLEEPSAFISVGRKDTANVEGLTGRTLKASLFEFNKAKASVERSRSLDGPEPNNERKLVRKQCQSGE